jgi:hypothetical protein
MASIPVAVERFDMGRVVSRAFGVIGRNLVLFFGLTLLLTTLPQILSSLLFAAGDGSDLSAVYIAAFIGSLVSAIGSYILTGALSYATVTDLNNDRPTFAKALGVGLRYAFPLFLLALVSMFGIYLGMIFLLVPGIIIGLMWSVAAPAMVTEGLGVFESLGRSRALTKGSRWQIFGLLLVAFIVVFVPLLIMPLLSGAFSNPQAAATQQFGISTIIQAVLGIGAMMILIAILAAIYVELRTIKEGASAESLASIFA